jgi:glutaredoxin
MSTATPRNTKNSPRVMLVQSKGKRQVPVIVEGDKVTVGYGGS